MSCPAPQHLISRLEPCWWLVFIEDNAILMPVLKVRKSLPPRQGLSPECRVERSYDRLNAVGSRSGSALSQRDTNFSAGRTQANSVLRGRLWCALRLG